MKTHSCKSCNHCRSLYNKSRFYFWKTDKYYCNKTETLTELQSCCECWQSKQKREYDLSPERLEQAEQDIKYIMDALGDL